MSVYRLHGTHSRPKLLIAIELFKAGFREHSTKTSINGDEFVDRGAVDFSIRSLIHGIIQLIKRIMFITEAVRRIHH
jgi:hypothetical protein